MKYPDYKTSLDLLKKSGCKDRVIRHVETVHRFSMIIGDRIVQRKHSIDLNLLEAGALLHDIGRSRTNGIHHAVEGAKIASNAGLSQDIIDIISNHIGAGITKEEAIHYGLPAKDYIPSTLEQKIVAAADNLTLGSEFQGIKDHVMDFKRQGLIEGAKRSMALHKELSDLCAIDLDELLLEAI